MVAILMVSARLVTLDLLEMKVFQIKCYKVIIPFHDSNKKILLHDSNHIVDVVM